MKDYSCVNAENVPADVQALVDTSKSHLRSIIQNLFLVL